MPGGKTVTCRLCRARAVAELADADEKIRVPAGWRRIVVLAAGSGNWLTSDGLDEYEVSDAYWLCPAHQG